MPYAGAVKRILGIATLALAGLAIAVGVTMATSSLSSQAIGISDEPVTAGQELAVPGPTPSPPRTTTAARPPADGTRTTGDDDEDRGGSDDRGGDGDGSGGDDSGRGRGRGRGGDDHDD